MCRRTALVAFGAKWPLKGVNISALGVKGQATPFLGHLFIQQTRTVSYAGPREAPKKSLGLSLPQEAPVWGAG